jgi:hypothetical protein
MEGRKEGRKEERKEGWMDGWMDLYNLISGKKWYPGLHLKKHSCFRRIYNFKYFKQS